MSKDNQMKKINWIKGCSHHFFLLDLDILGYFQKKEEKKLVKILVKTHFLVDSYKPHSKESVKGAKNGFTSYFSKNKN